MSIIVSDTGVPLAPSWLLERLHRLDPKFGLRFVPSSNCWALELAWRDADPRRELIQRGAIGNAPYDIVAYAPVDLKVEDSFEWLVRSLRRPLCGKREELDHLLNSVDDFNEKQVARNIEPTVEYAAELADANAATLFKEQGKGAPRVFLNDAASQGTSNTKRSKGREK